MGCDSIGRVADLLFCPPRATPLAPSQPPLHPRHPLTPPSNRAQRQVQVHGHKVSIEEMSRLIDAVSLDDIYRVANRVIRPKQSALVGDHKRSGKPTIVAQGKLANMPDVMTFFRRRGLA